MIRAGEDVAEYIFVRHDLRLGHGFLQASGLVFPRELALQVPFRPLLRFHQDVTWLLDVTNRHPDLLVIQSQQPLLRYTVGSGSVSSIHSQCNNPSPGPRSTSAAVRPGPSAISSPPCRCTTRGAKASPGLAVAAVVAAFRLGRPSWRATAYAGLSLLVMLPEILLTGPRTVGVVPGPWGGHAPQLGNNVGREPLDVPR